MIRCGMCGDELESKEELCGLCYGCDDCCDGHDIEGDDADGEHDG